MREVEQNEKRVTYNVIDIENNTCHVCKKVCKTPAGLATHYRSHTQPKNLEAKTRPVDNPYEIWKGVVRLGGDILNFEWRVLKKWQSDDNKPYARWFCAVKSEATYGNWEFGDVYVSEIKQLGTRVI